jgi:hypothetical protein
MRPTPAWKQSAGQIVAQQNGFDDGTVGQHQDHNVDRLGYLARLASG